MLHLVLWCGIIILIPPMNLQFSPQVSPRINQVVNHLLLLASQPMNPQGSHRGSPVVSPLHHQVCRVVSRQGCPLSSPLQNQVADPRANPVINRQHSRLAHLHPLLGSLLQDQLHAPQASPVVCHHHHQESLVLGKQMYPAANRQQDPPLLPLLALAGWLLRKKKRMKLLASHMTVNLNMFTRVILMGMCMHLPRRLENWRGNSMAMMTLNLLLS
mmetsp:Transcript_23835/g.40570  ORF Transcript_23835/g.40570 Transcript_23835/m.40570 type:complete len:215 (+) Transcript_23835:712-1356(+)